MDERSRIKDYWIKTFKEEPSGSEIAQSIRILRMVKLSDPFALMYAHFVRFYHLEIKEKEKAFMKDGIAAHDLVREILEDYTNLTNLMPLFRLRLADLESLAKRIENIEKKWNGHEERRLFMQLTPAEVTRLGLVIYWLTPVIWTAIVTIVLFLPR